MIVKEPKMEWRLAPRVLIVDDELKWSEMHQQTLERWGCEVVVAEGIGMELLADAVVKARKYECHLAIVDMCLLDDHGNDQSGLDLVAKLKPAESIVVSGYGDPVSVTRAIQEKGAVTFVGKGGAAAALREQLGQYVPVTCCATRAPKFHWQKQPAIFAEDDRRSLDEVEYVLARLFPEAQVLTLQPLSPAGGASAPRANGLVLQVWVDDLQPVFVKMARAERIQEEVEKYGLYIRGRLLGNYYVRQQNHALFWNWGAVCYDLLNMRLDRMQPFSNFFLAEPSPEQVVETLRHFFEETWSPHYERATEVEESLAQAYGRVWNRDLRELLGEIVEEERPLTFLSASAPLPNPICWLYERLANDPDRTVIQAVTHGDLHANNMMVDQYGRIWVIDYERTGPGPIYQDFVELETDILLGLTAVNTNNPLKLYKLLLSLAHAPSLTTPLNLCEDEACVTIKKSWLVVRALRRLAIRATGVDDLETYLWGALLNAVFRATLVHPLKANSRTYHAEYQRILLWGSILCQRLDELVGAGETAVSR